MIDNKEHGHRGTHTCDGRCLNNADSSVWKRPENSYLASSDDPDADPEPCPDGMDENECEIRAMAWGEGAMAMEKAMKEEIRQRIRTMLKTYFTANISALNAREIIRSELASVLEDEKKEDDGKLSQETLGLLHERLKEAESDGGLTFKQVMEIISKKGVN